MKNLITDFEIFINENYSFNGISLTEKDNKKSDDTLSGLSSATALIGSSVAKTTNKDAFNALQEGFKEIDRSNINQELLPLIYTAIKDEKGNKVDSMNENQALIFKKGRCSVGTKTEKSKNYLKIDNEVILSGDKGDLQVKDRKFGDIKKEGRVVEASGNGIFILGRLLKARATGAINDDTKVYLGINLKKPMLIVASAKTGIQSKDPGMDILIGMMAKGFFVPNDKNFQSWAESGRNLAKANNKELRSTLFDRNAIPTISSPDYTMSEIRKRLLEVGDASSLDTDKIFEGLKPERITARQSSSDLIKKLAKIFVTARDRMIDSHMKLLTERFKYFYSDIVAKDTGAPKILFDDINKQVDSASASMLASWKKSSSENWAIDRINEFFQEANPGSTSGTPGADSTVRNYKQEEGKY